MVRVHPGLLHNVMPSWSSLECSPACHAGDRRFKSDRGCLTPTCAAQGAASNNGAVRQPGRATDFKRPWMWVRLPLALLEELHASAGHWRAPVAVTHPPSGCGGSIPARRTDFWPVGLAAGCETLNLAAWVRLPYGLPAQPSGGIRRRATLRTSCPSWAWECKSPLGY